MSKKKHAKHSHPSSSSSGRSSRSTPSGTPKPLPGQPKASLKPQAAQPVQTARKLNPAMLYGGIAGVVVLVLLAVVVLTQNNTATQPVQTAASTAPATAAPAAQAEPATATVATTATTVATATSENQATTAATPAELAAEISVAQAASLRDKGAFMLDVREPDEWEEVHIPDATLIPLGTLSSRLADVPKDKEIVVVCRSGNRSKQGRDILLEAGFTRVTSMAGGMNDWRAAKLPTASGK